SGDTKAQWNRPSRHVPLQTPERVSTEQRPRAQTHQRVVAAHLRLIVQLQGNDERRETTERSRPADRPAQTPQ
ncbi:hypothetical protein M9458_031181, partial [Cirrhinus mrigala]